MPGPSELLNPSTHTRRLGRFGERAAARHLRRLGYRVVGTNVAMSAGEIDLICLTPELTALVVVEVKAGIARPGQGNAPRPEIHVNRDKADRLRLLARQAHASHQRRPGAARLGLRIDIIGVDAERVTPWARALLTGRFRVGDLRHHINALTP